jgi:N-acyl-D-aspartate/D-glutamate deacylase
VGSRWFLGALLCAGLICLAACEGQRNDGDELALDTLIINGLLYDGTDSPGRQVSLGIKGDRIAFLGDHNSVSLKARSIIDAQGKLLTPGFIDPHTHALSELRNPQRNANRNYLTQGVTTVILGNDGEGVYAVKELADSLEAGGIGTNVAFLVGHGTVREAAMGREDRAASAGELDHMKRLVEQAMKEGALGLSSGLYYTPGNFASTEEVIELAAVAARYQGLYESHIRDESTYNIGFLPALEEAINIGRQAGLPVHIAHIKALGVDVWGQSETAIAIIDSARESGLRVTADQYPWLASGTHLRNTVVPRWAMAGSFEEYQARLGNPELIPKIESAMVENLRRRGGPDSLLIVTCQEQQYVGKTLAEVAAIMELGPIDAAMKLLRMGASRVVSFNMDNADLRNFMSQPWVMTSSDGTDGHPRKYASFPQKYREYVVGQKIMSLQAFVHRSTGLTADTFGLANRGYLKPGFFADITILDPDTFGPEADYFNWNSLSTGVDYLFVNGALAIEPGAGNGALAGRALTRNGLR